MRHQQPFYLIAVERMHRYVFNDSKSTGLRPDRNDWS